MNYREEEENEAAAEEFAEARRTEAKERTAPADLSSAIRRAEAAEARAERLVKALMLCDRYCEHVHHEKHEQHPLGLPCPVEARIEAALKREARP